MIEIGESEVVISDFDGAIFKTDEWFSDWVQAASAEHPEHTAELYALISKSESAGTLNNFAEAERILGPNHGLFDRRLPGMKVSYDFTDLDIFNALGNRLEIVTTGHIVVQESKFLYSLFAKGHHRLAIEENKGVYIARNLSQAGQHQTLAGHFEDIEPWERLVVIDDNIAQLRPLADLVMQNRVRAVLLQRPGAKYSAREYNSTAELAPNIEIPVIATYRDIILGVDDED